MINVAGATKNIVVVGYPKSGCTWLARLIAELLDCSVGGLWDAARKGLPVKGVHRVSEFRCFKSHEQLHELERTTAGERLIYIIRDPRDIAVAGADQLHIARWESLMKPLIRILGDQNAARKFSQRFFSSEKYRLRRMCRAVLYGCARVHLFCRVPWKAHYLPYHQRGVLFVRYEDLHASPIEECVRILSFLEMPRDFGAIEQAIEKQSRPNRRSRFHESGEAREEKLLGRGAPGEWKQKLSASQKKLFLRELPEELSGFGYPSRNH